MLICNLLCRITFLLSLNSFLYPCWSCITRVCFDMLLRNNRLPNIQSLSERNSGTSLPGTLYITGNIAERNGDSKVVPFRVPSNDKMLVASTVRGN